MQTATLQLETLSCPSCMQKIEAVVTNEPGVDKNSVKVLFNASKVKVQFDSAITNAQKIADAIIKIGYQVKKISEK